MIRRIASHAILLAMIVVEMLLGLDLMWLVRGSLEWFPTEEQESTVRHVSALIAALLLVVELVLWSLLSRVQRSADEPRIGVN